MTICPNCRQNIPDGEIQCRNCGTVPFPLYCSRCGQMLDLRYSQCVHCGQPYILPYPVSQHVSHDQNKYSIRQNENSSSESNYTVYSKKRSVMKNKHVFICALITACVLVILILSILLPSAFRTNGTDNTIMANGTGHSPMNNSPSLNNSSSLRSSSSSAHTEYSHTALEGCVIVESNSLTGQCRYKTKCPICGTTSAGATTIHLTSGTLNTGTSCTNAKCSQFGEIFTVRIETKSKQVSY